jgi:hypothetical protein
VHLHLLGTLKNNEELEMAVHKRSQKQETNLHKDGIFKPVPRQEQIHQCTCGLCVEIMTFE